MDNTIDLDQAVGFAFKLAHRMRAAQISAGWDSVQKCLDAPEYEATSSRAVLFANFLITPDARNLSSYTLRAEALESAMIAMEGVISRCRIGFQSRELHEGSSSERETKFIKSVKDHMNGNTVCKDAKIILDQMIDLQVQLLNSSNNSEHTSKSPTSKSKGNS